MPNNTQTQELRALLAQWQADAAAVEKASTERYPSAYRAAKASRRKLEFEACRALPALLDHIERLEADDWQPIESAPKDGTEILAYSEHGCTGTMLVRHIALCDFFTDAEGDDYFRQGGTVESYEQADWFAADFVQGERLSPDCRPTHWRPLPAPPARLALEQQP